MLTGDDLEEQGWRDHKYQHRVCGLHSHLLSVASGDDALNTWSRVLRETMKEMEMLKSFFEKLFGVPTKALEAAQKPADAAVTAVGKTAVEVGKEIDKGAKAASETIQKVMKPVDELGAKVGSKKGRKGAKKDAGSNLK